MKKFFTLCLAFMLASLLNMNAADTYTLVGDLNSWNTSAEGYNFTYVEATDSYVLEDVTLKGEFKIVKNNSWDNPAFGANGNDVPLDAAYIMWNTDSGNMKMIDGKEAVYNDCKLELKVLGAKNASLRITSSTSMQAAIDTRADVWCVAGTFSDNEWNDAYEMTDLGNGVYELWSTELPSEFKFKAKDNWDISLGMHKEIKNTPIMGFDNAVDNGGENISLKTDKAYDLYRYTLTVRGWVASFRVDGYKQATQPVTVFYESFDACNSTGGNDGLFSGQNTANGSFTPDNDGWVVASKNGGNKCGKFGSSSKSGELTSPALGLTGDATLTFKAAPWGTDGTSLGLSISSGQLSESSLTMTADQWTEYTIKITGATPDATLTFTPAKRFFLDEVKVFQGDASADMKAAGISLSGIMKDAETAYYHHTLANPTVTVTLPAGATYMDVEVDNSGYITESRKNQTSDCTIPFYNAGNYTVRVTAYGEGVYSVASKDIAIETVSSVYTFDELINKGEGATCYLNFSPTVVAHVGKYLYLEGYDMWDGIRSSALVYASLDKTYNKGDVLQGFIATVSYYKGNPQLIPLTTSLGEPYSYSEPYVYEVEAGDAWKAFAVEANVNKYVRVKNAPVTANPDAVDGVTAYTKNLGVNMPEDVTKKYDVEGFINNFNGTIQIQPISFTAEEIKPFTYTEIVPANNAEVTSLSEIKITFPYAVEYDTTVTMGVLVMDGENMITPTVAVEGNVATLTFDAITKYGSKPSLNVMAGAFKETASKVGCEQIVANWSIPTPPVRADYMPINIDPADGSVVESIKNIYFYFDDENPCVTDKGYNAPYKGYVTVKDGNGNAVASDIYLDVKKVSGQWVGILQPKYGSSYTEPGTYVITLAEGLFSDQQYYDEDGKKGRVNPEFTITYTIKGAALAAPTVDPANGAEVENLNTITLTFAEAVTANAEAGAITIVNTSDAGSDYAKDIKVAISEDGLTATITCVPGYLDRWALGKIYKLNIPAGYFVATSGAASEALEYSWTIAAPKFTYVAVNPAQGDVTELSEILISFAQKTYGYGSNPTLNLVDADGNVVTTASTVRSTDANGNWFAIKATLKDKVTTPGTYTLVVPENSFTDVDFGDSGNKSAAFDLTWTVMEPDPNTYTLEYNVSPAEGVVTELTKIEFTPKAAGMIYMPIDEAQAANWVKVTDANGTVYNTTAKAGLGYEVSIEGVTEPGTYTVVVPKGSFYDFTASMSNPNSKNFNDEIVLTYTVEVAALAAPTVDPANGSEVENPSTVTLTFAEAVTVNAEAGELTMVNTSDAAYDYAKNFNVAISEDGLTATITCEPGYPSSAPRWAIGKTYKLNIPAGYFVATTGAASEALEYSWKVVPAPFTVASTTPEVGEVEKLDVIKVYFTENKVYTNIGYSWASLELVDNAGQVVTTGSVVKDGNYVGDVFKSYLVVTLAQPVTTPGQYTLVIPEGYARNVEWGEGAINVATNLTWTVMEPDPNTYDLALTSDPANGATVTELKTIKISAADASVIAMPTTEAQSAGWFTIKDAEGNSYNYTANTGLGIEIHIEGATAPGTYTVVVPAKSFVDAMTMTAASKRYNAEMVLTYTLQEEEEVDNTVYDMTLVSAKPANGSEVESLETIKLTFNYDDSINLRFAAKNTGWITVTDEAGNNYDAYMDDNWDGYVGDYIIYVSGATQPGTYTVTIPKGTVADDSYMNKEPYFLQGHANPEFTLTYTIVAPVVEDFTPVVNPTAGNITVDQMNVTVISVDSPIVSFDPGYVKYIKSLGNVWLETMGEYTISEDKLTLTLNWNLVKGNYPPGTSYTLELPAGCIVLENGAKNLLTQVAYTIVAGPKDLAEFVVPAGINGYINYDETDVNAWAPEFPFTVSTTAYNTVAFTAELPSLPAGITAMEVIDENGEVIATLNQDGVAPLADGEIYYVKGETTKEYVDGAELKFRFRFTHLGVSETIQFSYIIAGGNITSIADVELDGNVIVRGNDIIAPQGAAIFTVSGIRVPAEGLAPGVYVVVLGNQAVKVMVK